MDATAERAPPRIGILHTSPATIDLFGRLLREAVAGVRIVNVLDDSILPELAANGGDVNAVRPRWTTYASTVGAQGVDLILNACSSIGELCADVEPVVGCPVVRVDAEMARVAVGRGPRVAAVATLQTTLRPTRDLLAATAAAAGERTKVRSVLADGAYARLMAGDQAGHDDAILAALASAADTSDVIVLAQASMARVVPRLRASDQARVLASPAFAVADVVRRLAMVRGGLRSS